MRKNMTKPIALQLYTVREHLARDFVGTMRRIAEMGYAGVEAFPDGVTAVTAKRLFDDLGLTVCASHAPLPLGEQKQESLDRVAALGCTRLVCAWLPPDEYKSVDSIRRLCGRVNEAAAVAHEHGLTLVLHNHWFEFERVEGTRPYHLWQQYLDPAIDVELDAYWAKVGGVDPVVALKELGNRVTLLHVKNGPADRPQSDMTAVGQGALNYEAIIPAAATAEWLIVELDRCATDMLTAVQESYTYLTEKGLGYGNKSI
jgi:sugar phosphate isomerase/epimerase